MSTASREVAVPVEQITVPANVRALDAQHVDALAGSIELQGVLVPLVVRPAEHGYELVAGFHRLAAARRLGLRDIPVVVRDAESEDADRAVENIARKQLDPYEEAKAVHAMLARGLSHDGAAQALGWPKQRITSRVKLLDLPERAQQLIGDGTIPLSAVERLREIGQISPALLDAVVDYLADGNEHAAQRLQHEPGWLLDAATRDSKAFAARLDNATVHQIAVLKLGAKIEQLYTDAQELQRKLDRYAYQLRVSFTDADVDRARAAGVLLEFEHQPPVIVDRPLYRQLLKEAIKRTHAHLTAQVEQQAAERKQRRGTANAPNADVDPVDAARRERGRKLRDLADQAHNANLDLGHALIHNLSSVDPTDLNVARFFVYALLGPEPTDGWSDSGDTVRRIAAQGIRYCVDELRTDITKTRKDGTRGRLRIDYGDHRNPDTAIKWLWRYLHAASSAGELYGRALVAIAAEQHASRLVVAGSQRTPAKHWGSRDQHAATALTKLVKPHLPVTLSKLEQAVKRAHSTYDKTARNPCP